MIVPLILMILIVVFLDYVLKYQESRIYDIIKCIIIGIVGAVTYFYVLYKNNGLNSIFGQERINNILKKLHLK